MRKRSALEMTFDRRSIDGHAGWAIAAASLPSNLNATYARRIANAIRAGAMSGLKQRSQMGSNSSSIAIASSSVPAISARISHVHSACHGYAASSCESVAARERKSYQRQVDSGVSSDTRSAAASCGS